MKKPEQFKDIEVSLVNESWLGIYARRKRSLQLGQDSNNPRRLIAVFGGNAKGEESTSWQNSYKVGQEIAKRGGIV
ncbi:hypothetical protein K9N50_02320, partial [bacterium]|nr:hypothetical protein [bacterium]